MNEAGIELVRIAEFAWSRIEPSRDQFDWQWLDDAVTTLHNAGLKIIMCTPTACPPRWLVDEMPDILPVDSEGRVRGFGSRRHYRFASNAYRREAQRISAAVIDRYAAHEAVVGWQTDNEFGCHDTVTSYADDDRAAFQQWLQTAYGTVDALNSDWGNVFWSQEYQRFDQIDTPNLTVTEPNPAHQFAWRCFASDQVSRFNAQQVELIRNSAGADRWITHNFMGNSTDFDHFPLGHDLDVATWDSYPLGFLDQGWASDREKQRYRRIGHPDWAAFHHDLYHAVGRGRFGVMEQQPGPVNWAPSNAEPLDSAPAFWGMEAIAHGAELVSYFRFQQMPQAQEQMHAALRLSDGSASPAFASVQHLAQSIRSLPDHERKQAQVALLFDYRSCWASDIQHHAAHMGTLEHAIDAYSAGRSLGLDIDIIGQDADLNGYKLLIIPGTVFVSERLISAASTAGVKLLALARSGSRNTSFSLPDNLAPGALQSLLPVRVVAVDSIREGSLHKATALGAEWEIRYWRERIDSPIEPIGQCDDGTGFWYRHQGHHYLNARLDAQQLAVVMQQICRESSIAVLPMPEGLRRRCRGNLVFLFNFSPEPVRWTEGHAQRIQGNEELKTGEWAVWLSESHND
jgi:beta-galactosidase